MEYSVEHIIELYWLCDKLHHIDLDLVAVNQDYTVTL